jgi:hypothetical protein
MQEIEREHVELNSFFELLRNTPIEDINCEYGKHTKLVTRVVTPEALLDVTYSNIKPSYRIKYKGLTIKEERFELKQEHCISDKIKSIMAKKEDEIKKEFLSKYKVVKEIDG